MMCLTLITTDNMNFSYAGVVFVDGPFMHEQRKFSIHQLRNFGLGKAPMFDIVTKEALEIVELIMSKYEVSICCKFLLTCPSSAASFFILLRASFLLVDTTMRLNNFILKISKI